MVLDARRSTAFHEAGHAVVALSFGLPFFTVTIVADDEAGSLGHVTHPTPIMIDFGMFETKAERKRAAREQIIACYAGLEAQRLYDPKCSAAGARVDDEIAFDLSREYGVHPRGGYVGDDRHHAHLGRLRSLARRRVRQLRPAIAALAEALLMRPIMTQAEAEAVVAHRFRPVEPRR